MIPQTAKNFAPASLEDVMFDALTQLTDDYYVFHSFRITNVSNSIMFENETDFVIFNPNKGVICLEAKAGHVRYEDGEWRYSSGVAMNNGGPFQQAQRNKYKLINYLKENNMSAISKKCKFLHAVWFPSITTQDLQKINLPAEAEISIVMTKEALTEPQKFIDGIFETELPNHIETTLSKNETAFLISKVLCPEFDVFPTSSFENDLKKIVFHRLLKEQTAVLNFLGEQRTAVINGAAGTGKTMVAIEKAKRHAISEENVLFLCYNSELKNFLSYNYQDKYISYYTIDGLACKLCNTSKPDYNKLQSVLDDYYINENFPYQHIIIDEGQDFGQDRIEDAEIINTLHDIVNDRDFGSFYIFYDQLQLVQGNDIQKYIKDADCKLTLYRNCRNTENIAKTSLKPISQRKFKMMEGSVIGLPATFRYSSDNIEQSIDNSIAFFRAEGLKNKDIVIVTCKTESKSALADFIKNGNYKNEIKFTTCRKFKGLESDAIILVDVDFQILSDKNALIYYVGASRARLYLQIITDLTDADCINLLENMEYSKKIKKPKKDLAAFFNGTYVVE